MADKIEDGGQAFPQAGWRYDSAIGRYVESVSGGMSLRDWFAGQAIAGICANADWWACAHDDQAAVQSYQLADAMLAQRGVPPRQIGLTEAAKAMLTLHDDFMAGRPVDRAQADRMHLAACFGAAAHDACGNVDAAPIAMLRAFLVALIGPASTDLDYLRAAALKTPEGA